MRATKAREMSAPEREQQKSEEKMKKTQAEASVFLSFVSVIESEQPLSLRRARSHGLCC